MAERGSLAEAQTQDLAQEATVQYQVEKLMASLIVEMNYLRGQHLQYAKLKL